MVKNKPFKMEKITEKKNKKLAIFDIDGTIFRKNLHFELLSELVYMKIFPHEVKKQLVKVYGNWLNNEGTYENYRDKLVNLYAENIKGCHKRDIERAAQIVSNFNIKRVYIFARDLIAKIRSTHFLLAISGSPIEIVSKYSSALGFDFSFGSVYEVDENGYYTGKSIFEPIKNKGIVVKQFVYENNLTLEGSFGIGDTESDASFLEMVDNPVVFNPNLNLKKIADRNNWKIVVEKKDVIYDITSGCEIKEVDKWAKY